MTESRLDRFLRTAFKIEQGELFKTAVMFWYLFSAVGAFVIGRITRDTLFLTEWPEGRAQLAHMYYVAPLSVSLVAYLYSRIADRFRRDRLIQGTTAILIAGLLIGVTAGRALVGEHAFYIGLYIFVEIMGMFLTLQFWTFANDVIDVREGKRLFSVIATGGVVASIVCGQLVQALISVIGIGGLLLLCSGLLATCIVAVTLVSHRERRALATVSAKRSPTKRKILLGAESSRLLSSSYLMFLALLVTATFVACPLVDYQWKVMASEAYPDKLAFAAYQGNFYTVTGIASFFFQLILTRSILKHFGIFVALMVLPGFILTGTIVNLVAPALLAVTLAKGSETAFRYTINDTSLALLYMTIPAHQRGKVKAFIEGIVKNWALASAGLLLAFVLKPLLSGPQQLSWVLLVPIACWFACLIGLKRRYVPQLLALLKRGGLDRAAVGLDVGAESTVDALRRALASNDESEVLQALDLLRSLETLRLDDPIVLLLTHGSARIRVAAAQELARTGDPVHAEALERAIDDGDEEVRISAIRTVCAIRQHAAIPLVRPFLSAPSPAIRSAAIVGLIRHGGLDGVLCAADELKRLIGHEHPGMRVHAARVLGAVGVRNFYQPLLGLLEDPSREVQMAAIEAAGALQPPELVPLLVSRLGGSCSLAAGAALAAYAEGVEPVLEQVLSRSEATLDSRMAAAACLAQLGTPQAFAVLERALDLEAEAPLRYLVYRALDRLLQAHPHLTPTRKRIREVCRRELGRIHDECELAYEAGALAADPLLEESLATRRKMMVRGVFHLLNILHPEGRFNTLWDNLGSANRATRSNAIEVIDTVVERGLRERVLIAVESRTLQEQVERERALESHAPSGPGTAISRLLSHESPWVTAAALSALVRGRSASGEPLGLLAKAAAAREHPSALVRQTWIWAIASDAPKDPEVIYNIDAQRLDPRPEIRNFASATLRELGVSPKEQD